MEDKRYRMLLYQRAFPEEFNWDEDAILGFLGTRLSGTGEAQRILQEVDRDGTATRYIEYYPQYEVRVVVSRGRDDASR